ncbi:hypothetical protein B0I35DRAFT_351062 [Stachybotrys elegans]|uniref:Pre-rRNA processing protein n=1 Tax=Stachybotrys elegans TaxID=80388 RepID=A0A8K0SUV2_9HYPO|nr:hypothetical protein B0I35DRAFT_351062 [Stachybotrys elegans]
MDTSHPDDEQDGRATEATPLLANRSAADDDNDDADYQHASAPQRSRWAFLSRFTRWSSEAPRRKWPWPSIIAITILGLLVICIMLVGFLVPPAVKEYAETAAVVEPTNLSLESITSDGVRVRIQANFRLDASRVQDKSTRRIGKFVTSIVRKLDTDKATVRVSLPLYHDAVLGTADIPPLTVSLANGYTTSMDFVADLAPGDAEKIRSLANDWLEGRLQELKLTGATSISIKSGILPLGTHQIAESFVLEAGDMPSMPEYKIGHLDFHDMPDDGSGKKAVGADVTITAHNGFPVSLEVPALAFEVLVPNCDESEPYIKVGDASTDVIRVFPNEDVTAHGKGVVREISKALVRVCPHTDLSPLDSFMKRYLNGEDSQVLVRGQKSQGSDIPGWIEDIIGGIALPLELPGRSFGNLIRNFSVTNVDFKLPSPFAEPNDPDGQPRVSGTIQVLAVLPPEFNIDVGVDKLRADADLYYKKKKLGELNLRKWQAANSSRLQGGTTENDLLNITSTVLDVPLNITDGDVFGDVLQKVLFGSKDVLLDVKAAVDVGITTVLGNLVLKEVPAEGTFPVKHLPGDTLTSLSPNVTDMRIVETTETGFQLQALANFTNPTPYTAWIPKMNVHVFKDDMMIAEAVATEVDLQLGNNSNVSVQATWDPMTFGGEEAHRVARRLLSDYISGKNATLTFRSHRDSIPHMPLAGEGASRFNFTFTAPRLKLPGTDDDDDDDDEASQRFIRDATFHIFSSSATFTLASPLHHNTIYVEHISAVAYYNHTEPVGSIVYDSPFAAPPGLSRTPSLPVEWSAGHVGYDKLRDALGGSLKLDAVANVTMRLGNWVETVYYEGKGIGAKVSL